MPNRDDRGQSLTKEKGSWAAATIGQGVKTEIERRGSGLHWLPQCRAVPPAKESDRSEIGQ